MCETAAEKNRHTVPAGSRNYKEYDKNPKRPDLFRNCREKLKKALKHTKNITASFSRKCMSVTKSAACNLKYAMAT